MRFGREMHHVGDLVIANDAADGLAVAEIHFFEDVIRSAFDIGEICEVTCVGEAIEINEAINCGLIDDVPDKIGANAQIVVTREMVQEKLTGMVKNRDLSDYLL